MAQLLSKNLKNEVKMKNQKGFTLTELLVVMVIGSIVIAGAFGSYVSQQKAYTITESITFLQQNLRSAMYFIEKDLRMAGFNPRKENAFGFTSIASDSFTFTKDIGSSITANDENGVVDAGETIAYDMDSGNLRRDTGGGPLIVAESITGMTLQYLDKDGNTTADPGSVRSVSVTLTATDGSRTRSLSSLIKCRNMGL
jgi:type IV pilus assembly protein PilW